MIRTVAWFCAAEQHGVWSPGENSWEKPSPAFFAEDIPDFVQKPVKYYSRMTRETRCCLFAATLALGDAERRGEIGLISAGSNGWLAASAEYFRDYVTHGRNLGRGNLFIYTLPTSAAGEVAIALELTGPCMFIHDSITPVNQLVRVGKQMIADHEADQILAIYSEGEAAVCWVIDEQDRTDEIESFLVCSGLPEPIGLCRKLRDRVRPK